MRAVILTLAVVLPALAQGPVIDLPFPFERFPPSLRVYLGLTEQQADKIASQNSLVQRWSETRSQRLWQVQGEIAGETAKDPLNPGALGVRYAEVEAIRREIADRNKKLVEENLAVLTPAQTLKLKALEEALKLVPTGSEAKAVKLLPDDCSGASSTMVPAARVIPVSAFGYTTACRTAVYIYDPAYFGHQSARGQAPRLPPGNNHYRPR